ncbi:hypothetical protein VTK56DRAFT_2396 [Thermocarpiscus australiensis]
MRRLNLVILASLQLCQARQPSFSIHDDLLAYPQFEVVFADDFISESDALVLLESRRFPSPTHSADFPSQTDLASNVRESPATGLPHRTKRDDGRQDGDDDDEIPISETYELINSPPWRYLCAVPVIAPPPALNQTATELAKAEEARELSRASARGWELMSGLDGHCLYYMSGWWSYSFCYGKGVVQFHAHPSGNKGGLPVKDDNSQEYVLGRVSESWDPHRDPASADEAATKSIAPPNSHLQVKGDQRYLVQRLEGGTECDLTGRPRTIEVQYHCNPGASIDRIGWVKEVTTCTYLMVVQTPRLCADVAFLPPKETRAHPIKCRQIIAGEEEESAWRYRKRVEAGEQLVGVGGTQKGSKTKGPGKSQFQGMTIGGVVVGGQKVVGGQTKDGKPAAMLTPPRRVAAQPAVVDILARKKKDEDTVEFMSDEELGKKWDLDPKTLEELRQYLQDLAGDRGWKIEIIQTPGGGYELVGAFEQEDGQEGGGQRKQVLAQGTTADQKAGSEKTGDKDAEPEDDEEQAGSQEVFFKEEL